MFAALAAAVLERVGDRFVNRPPSSASSPGTVGIGPVTTARRGPRSPGAGAEHVVEHAIEVDRAHRDALLARPRVVEDRLDEAPQREGGAPEPVGGLHAGRSPAVGEHRGMDLDHHERLHQLVRRDGGEGVHVCFLAFELGHAALEPCNLTLEPVPVGRAAAPSAR